MEEIMADIDFFKQRPEVKPTIYVYKLPDVASHKGYLKVGYTDREDYEYRINEQLHTSGIKHETVFVVSAMRSDGTCFTDHDIHAVLKRKGIKQLYEDEDKNEWFKCSVSDIKSAVLEVRDGVLTESSRTATFKMRPEQVRAVQITEHYFKEALKEEPTKAPKFLWNCKMRFGKTFASYQLSKKMGFKRVLILTFKPAVESAWKEDLLSHVDFDGWQFISDKDAKNDNSRLDYDFEQCDKSKPIVVFASFQNVLGVNENGGIKAKITDTKGYNNSTFL